MRRDDFAYRRQPLWLPLGAAATPTLRLVIAGGNTLATGQLGIKYQSTPVTNVPSAYDPTVTSSFIAGIGRGTLYSDGVSLGFVLVLLDSASPSAINFDLLGDTDPDVASVFPTLATLTVGGSPTVTVSAYRPDSLVG